ncbi:MAG: metal-dependent transcriptional regulator [Clostridia bacterium]|nr:metal-dependent transcriptional regulator [Clostridia bacterium]
MISKALEEYLKTIYVLKKQNGNIRVTDIANKMNCSKAGVNKAINNLKANELINYETYGTIELTKSGEELAKKILETYDIVYLFFKEVLNIEDEKAKQEAEKVKLVITDDTVNKLAKYTHKVLDLYDLDCDYDVNQERCRSCKRRTLRDTSQK